MPLPASTARPFFGSHVVAATFLLVTFGWGVGFYGPPVFLYAVVARTGWPVPMVSAAVSVHFLLVGRGRGQSAAPLAVKSQEVVHPEGG